MPMAKMPLTRQMFSICRTFVVTALAIVLLTSCSTIYTNHNDQSAERTNLEFNRQAVFLWDTVIRLQPNMTEAYRRRADSYFVLGEYKKAIDDCTKVIQLDPKDAGSYNNRGYAYALLGECQKAIEDCGIAITLNPKFAQAYDSRAYAYHRLGEYQKAIDDYTQAISLDPNVAGMYCHRGNAYGKLQDYQNAIDDCTKAINLDSQYTEAYSNRGSAYAGLGEYQKAIDDYTTAISLDPKDGYAYYGRADPFEKLGKTDLAQKDREKAKELGYTLALADVSAEKASRQEIPLSGDWEIAYRMGEKPVHGSMHLTQKGTEVHGEGKDQQFFVVNGTYSPPNIRFEQQYRGNGGTVGQPIISYQGEVGLLGDQPFMTGVRVSHRSNGKPSTKNSDEVREVWEAAMLGHKPDPRRGGGG